MSRIAHLLLIILIALTWSSCTKQEDQEVNKNLPASATEIQGTWGQYRNGTYYYITFADGSYELNVVNVFSEGMIPLLSERGTYSMSRQVMTLTTDAGPSTYSPLEVYWNNNQHTQLNLYPLGTFTPSQYTSPYEEVEDEVDVAPEQAQ